MFSRLASTAALFAEDGREAERPEGRGRLLLDARPILLPFIAIVVLFYFLLIRPQRREQARRLEMFSGRQEE